MSRRQRRMYRHARGQAILKGCMLLLTAAVVLTGLAGHLPGRGGFQAETLVQPTATPVTAAFDETVTSREVSLSAGTWYAIQTGVYSTREAAESRADTYADRGAPGYVAEDGGKWRVFIACYGDRNDAAAVRERLSAMQQVDTHLHEWSAPAVTLRLSGMAGQLDVAEAGMSLPGQTAALLRNTAIALDAGETSVESVQGSVTALEESIALWAKTARERFAVPYPAMVEAVLAFAEGWEARQEAIRQAEDATALSAQLKKQAMAVFDEDIALRYTLLGE